MALIASLAGIIFAVMVTTGMIPAYTVAVAFCWSFVGIGLMKSYNDYKSQKQSIE